MIDENQDPDIKEAFWGMESMDQAPTLEIQLISNLLREPPTKPVKTGQGFKKLLGLKLHRNQYSNAKYDVTEWLKVNQHDRSIIDHDMVIILANGDFMLLTQPYSHPTKQDVAKVEVRGGYVVSAHEGWGFLHHCRPTVYLVPASAIPNFKAA